MKLVKTENIKKLTKPTLKKYRLVVDEWFNNKFNGKQAYLRYYPKVKDQTATTNFSKLKEFPEIQEYINEKREAAAAIIESSHEAILHELLRWLQADITETIGLSPDEIKELPIELKRLINNFKHTVNKHYDKKGKLLSESQVIVLGFVSKERAMEMINKHLGFYAVDNAQKVPEVNYDELEDNVLMKIWNARKQT
jgi:phage terminase small subunit